MSTIHWSDGEVPVSGHTPMKEIIAMTEQANEPAYRIEVVQDHFRITHSKTDSRIATCYDRRDAELVVAALNAHDPAGEMYP